MLRDKIKLQFSILAIFGFLGIIISSIGAVLGLMSFIENPANYQDRIQFYFGTAAYTFVVVTIFVSAYISIRVMKRYSSAIAQISKHNSNAEGFIRKLSDFMLIEVYEMCRKKQGVAHFADICNELVARGLATENRTKANESLIIDTGGPILSKKLINEPNTVTASRYPVYTRYLSEKFIFVENTSWKVPIVYKHDDIVSFRTSERSIMASMSKILEITYSNGTVLLVHPNIHRKWIEILQEKQPVQ